MQDLLNSKSNNEINLSELFITLWAYKLLIASTCILGIMLGGYYILNLDKKFSSEAVFLLDKTNNNMPTLPSEQLSKIIGLKNISNASSKLPTDLINGRVFIEKLDTKLNFQLDPYFNTYNPSAVDPIWKSLIKRTIGWQKSSRDTQEAIWQSIVSAYVENVKLKETDHGAIKIITTHTDPNRAAEISNGIMSELISHKKNRRNTDQDQQLSYLSTTLAKALGELEMSQSNLKKFTLENSALPLESFAEISLRLEALREQLKRTSELHDAVAALSLLIKNKTTNQNNYLELRQQFPIVDHVEFRRVLGQNEIISSWNWPNISSVTAVFDTLAERKSRLQSQINTLQKDANRSGIALNTYAKLQREVDIAEASYTVLIENVKSQSMAAGYRPDKTEIYEYASASINPSWPKNNLILALGAVLGVFFGSLLSLLFAQYRDVCYSKNALRNAAQARYMGNARHLKSTRGKSLDDVNTILVNKPQSFLRDIVVAINKSTATQVVVTSSLTKLTGNNLARALACYMQSDTTKVAIIDFSSTMKNLEIGSETISVGSFVVAESLGHMSILRLNSDLAPIELLRQKDFLKNTESLNSTFDLVFLCADNSDAISLLSALEERKTFHITLAKTKKTKSANLMLMHSLLPIQGLFYE